MNLNVPAMISAYLARLAPRERILLGVASVSAVLMGVYVLVWVPMLDERDLLQRNITRSSRQLSDIQTLRNTYFETRQRIKANQAAIDSGNRKFNLFSYVQGTVKKAVSADRIASMNPSTKDMGNNFFEERVEIKINQIDLDALVDFVYRIEKGTNPLRFSRLQVKKRRDDNFTFDVTAVVSLLKSSEQVEES